MKTYHLSPEQLPFDLDLTLDCGQVFRWKKIGSEWTGVIAGKVVTISHNGDILTYDGINETQIIRYFNLEIKPLEVINHIKSAITLYACETGNRTDELFESVIAAGAGLRIIRQDFWECLICFICSQNSNIPTISKRISLLCEKYGKTITNNIWSFPSPADLAESDEEELRTCCTGYRAPYLAGTARYILRDPDFLSYIDTCSTQDAKDELMKLPGVGPKVADCILLFAYNRYEVVPVDVWIRNIITSLYPEVRNRRCNKKECSYNDIADFCREYFGEYAGYAQQYFFASRQTLPVKQGERN